MSDEKAKPPLTEDEKNKGTTLAASLVQAGGGSPEEEPKPSEDVEEVKEGEDDGEDEEDEVGYGGKSKKKRPVLIEAPEVKPLFTGIEATKVKVDLDPELAMKIAAFKAYSFDGAPKAPVPPTRMKNVPETLSVDSLVKSFDKGVKVALEAKALHKKSHVAMMNFIKEERESYFMTVCGGRRLKRESDSESVSDDKDLKMRLSYDLE